MRSYKGRCLLDLVLVFAMAVSVLTGCGGYGIGKKEEKVTLAAAASSDVFQEIPTPLDGVTAMSAGGDDDMGRGGIFFSSPLAQKGKYYTLCSDVEAGSAPFVSVFDGDGKNASKIELPCPEEGTVNWISADAGGRIYVVCGEPDKEGNLTYSITCLSQKQKEVWVSRIEADLNFEPLGLVSTDTFTALLSDSSLLVFDNEKGKEKRVQLPRKDLMAKICLDKNGNLLLIGWSDNNEMGVWSLDADTLTFKKTRTWSEGIYYAEALASGTGDYDFYLADGDGVWGFTTDGARPVRIVDFIASNQEFSEISAMAILSRENVLIFSYDEDMNCVARLLKKMDPKAASQKKTITVGCLRAAFQLKDDLYKFNRKSDKYRIKLIEYSPSDEDVGTLNSVIAAGQVPDILCVSDNMPVESYIKKGVFEDIGPYFEGDAQLSGDQYFENILDAYRINGKMYFITPSFSLMGMAGSKKVFGDKEGVSIDHLTDLIENRKMDYEKALGMVTRDEVLKWITDYSNDQFVDMEKGTCSYNSDSFIRLLKFAKKFPKKLNIDLYVDCSDWVRAGDQLLSELYLSDMSCYQNMRYGTFGEDISYMGFPGNGSAGPVIYCPYYLGMTSESRNKEACWEFLRDYYLDDYQNSINNDFPVSRKAFDRQVKKAMTPEYFSYTDEKGEMVTELIQPSFYIGGAEIRIPFPGDKDVEKVVQYIERADTRSSVDGHISSILNEEVGAFFSGQKSAEETADIIQRRVRIYILEIL